ncbi:MAG: paraquat-inducible protein A [Desulforhopalus sp.]
MASSLYIACHACDVVHHTVDVPRGGAARCARCGSPLYRPKRDSINRTFALSLAAVVFYLIANTTPFLGFKIGPQIQETTLLTGIINLFLQDMYAIAMLVLFTVVVVPGIHLLCLMYILVFLKAGRTPYGLARTLRIYLLLKPWGMMEIFMLAILVAAFKLLKMATIIPGIALFAFTALIFLLAAISVTFDEHLIWERIEYHE